jgi:hypothetical protein
MSRVEIEFLPELGLVFWRVESNSRTKLHEVNIETLKQMSLADLEHCISANIIFEHDELQSLFSEYLWSNCGIAKPLKSRREHR